MRKLIQQPLIFCLILMLSLQACKNYQDFPEIDEVDYRADLAAPVFHGTINIEDLIEDTAEDLDELSIQADGSILFSYEADAMEQDVSEFLEPLPDFPVATNQPSITIPFNFTQGYQVSSMILKSGTIALTARNGETPEDVNLTIRFPDLKLNGQMFSVNTTLDYNGSMPVEATIPAIDLSGYVLGLTNDSLTIEYQATNTQGDPVDISLVSGEAKSWVPSQINGVWEREAVEVNQDTIEIDLFNEDYIAGNITFTDPRFTLVVDNSFGVATRIMVRSMDVVTVDNQVLSLEGSVMNNGFNINYPGINEVGTSKQTIFSFDKDNSNIAAILNSRPVKMIFVIDAIVNPDNSSAVSFLHEDSKINIGVKAELSAGGMASGFKVEEEFTVDVKEEDVERIDYVELKLISRNGIPLNASTQFYFLNMAGEKVDSLFAEGAKTILAAAQANASGNAADAPEQITRVTLTRDQIDHLLSVPEMISSTSLSTTNNGSTPISINVNQELEMKMGIRVKLK